MAENEAMTSAPRDDEKLTDSQVIAFRDVPASVRGPQQQRPEHQRSERQQAAGPVSVIGETVHFKGELSAGEDLIIEGKIEGSINQGKCCLTVKPKGELVANVDATKIFVEGMVTGDLAATVSVSIRDGANVAGNIVAPSVSIKEGATFNGHIEMRSPKSEKGSE